MGIAMRESGRRVMACCSLMRMDSVSETSKKESRMESASATNPMEKSIGDSTGRERQQERERSIETTESL